MKTLGNLLALVLLSQVLLCLAEEPTKIQFDPNSASSKEHLKEDLNGVINRNLDDMSVEEMQFHYFREHDYDNDHMLDGNEIARKLLHRYQLTSDSAVKSDDSVAEQLWPDTEAWLMSKVDEALHKFDKNADGFIDLLEYKKVLNTA